jgi:hypothetical protein
MQSVLSVFAYSDENPLYSHLLSLDLSSALYWTILLHVMFDPTWGKNWIHGIQDLIREFGYSEVDYLALWVWSGKSY